jgi:hypothetical protein
MTGERIYVDNPMVHGGNVVLMFVDLLFSHMPVVSSHLPVGAQRRCTTIDTWIPPPNAAERVSLTFVDRAPVAYASSRLICTAKNKRGAGARPTLAGHVVQYN